MTFALEPDHLNVAKERWGSHGLTPSAAGSFGSLPSLLKLLFHYFSRSKLRQKPELQLTQFLTVGSVGHVYLGWLKLLREQCFVAAKVAQEKHRQALLHNEAKVYAVLSDLQGSMVPRMYGLYADKGILMLLTQRVGRSIKAFKELSPAQRYVGQFLL